MSGYIKLHRNILDHRIWTNVAEVRLFIYLILQAHHGQEPMRIGDVTIQRGQYLRSYRQLQEDLVYIEEGQVRKYGLGKIKRIIEHLKAEVQAEETKYGTLFTVLKYAQYQAFELEKNGPRNSSGTPVEQEWNNNKKGKNNNFLPPEENIATPKKKKAEYHQDAKKLVGFLWQELKKRGVEGLPQTQYWADMRVASSMLERHPAQDILSGISWLLTSEYSGPRINRMKAVEFNFPLYQRRGELAAHKKPAGTQIAANRIVPAENREGGHGKL